MNRGIGCTAVAVALVLSGPMEALAQQSEAYLLTDRVIGNLDTLGEVRDLMEKAAASGSDAKADPLEAYVSTLISIRTAILRTEDARFGLARFKASETRTVNQAATTLDAVCVSLGVLLKQLMDLINEENQSTDPQIAIKMAPRAAEVMSNLNEAWRLVPMVAVATTHALVDQGKLDSDGTLGTLTISALERAALRQRFENISIEKMRHHVDLALWLLRDFLGKDGWKTR